MSEDTMIEAKIREIIDQEIKPAIAMHGGIIEFCGYENGIVKVRLAGACGGCPGATMTLKLGVEARLKERLPEVKEVQAV